MNIINVPTTVTLSIFDEKYAGDILYHTLGETDYGYFHNPVDKIAWAMTSAIINAMLDEKDSTDRMYNKVNSQRITADKLIVKLQEENAYINDQLEEAQKSKVANPDTLIKLTESDMSTDNIIQLHREGII
jgi:hypothetical protein